MSKVKIVSLAERTLIDRILPLDLSFGDGIILDFHHKPTNYEISINDVILKLKKINYTLKPNNIIFFKTNKIQVNDNFTYHTSISPAVNEYLYTLGIRILGIDSSNLLNSTALNKNISTKKCCCIENLTNLNQLPTHGFKVALLPEREINNVNYLKTIAIFEC